MSIGRQATLADWADRKEAEAASAYMDSEDTSALCLFSGFCQAALPHRKLPDADAWQVTSGHITLIVDPGKRPGANGTPEPVGVPYGSRARLIMLYLQSEALRTNSRAIQLGRSMRDWLGRMSVPIGGKPMALVRDQAERISRCHLSFNIKSGNQITMTQQSIVDGAMFLQAADGKQGSLFLEIAKLSEGFFAELQRHSVPLEEAAIRAINNNSMALDLYAWLAYRLHVLARPTPVSWTALKNQFGTGFNQTFHFRPSFLSNLRLALAVYPDAKVDTNDRGVVLLPSRPPVAPRLVAVHR